MNIADLLKDKTLNAKQKTAFLSRWLPDEGMAPTLLLAFAQKAKGSQKASCIEAMEQASLQNPGLVGSDWFGFVTEQLTDKAPRVKWESAKVVANTAHLFPKKLDKAIAHLLGNTEHTGTVVRWSAALALARIVGLKTPHNKTLVPAIKNIMDQEEKNSIKKIYAEALKKVIV